MDDAWTLRVIVEPRRFNDQPRNREQVDRVPSPRVGAEKVICVCVHHEGQLELESFIIQQQAGPQVLRDLFR